MKKTIRLSESQLIDMIKRIINEQESPIATLKVTDQDNYNELFDIKEVNLSQSSCIFKGTFKGDTEIKHGVYLLNEPGTVKIQGELEQVKGKGIPYDKQQYLPYDITDEGEKTLKEVCGITKYK